MDLLCSKSVSQLPLLFVFASSSSSGVSLYEIKMKQFQQYLDVMKDVDPYHRQKLNDNFKRDSQKMDSCYEILVKLSQPQSKMAWLEDVWNNNRALADLTNCKVCIDESLGELARLMIVEKFEDENASIPVNKIVLESIEAKNFWIQRFGLLQTEIDLDSFAEQYQKYCKDIFSWMPCCWLLSC